MSDDKTGLIRGVYRTPYRTIVPFPDQTISFLICRAVELLDLGVIVVIAFMIYDDLRSTVVIVPVGWLRKKLNCTPTTTMSKIA
jgi:hypothetical protein